MKDTLAVTGNPEADQLLADDPLALVLGMLLDQQVPMEWAFSAPLTLRQRLGGSLETSRIAATDIDELTAVFRGPPALHRYPGSMAKRAQALCRHVVEHHGGDPARLWEDAGSAEDLYRRIRALPGYGEEKTRIFIALLAKRFDRAPAGWEAYAGPYADSTPRSVADVDSPETLERVRAFKRARKAEGKGKDG